MTPDTPALKAFNGGFQTEQNGECFYTFPHNKTVLIRADLQRSAELDTLREYLRKEYSGHEHNDVLASVKKLIALKRSSKERANKVDGLVEALKTYYLPQLKFSMGGHRAFAIEHEDKKEISASHHGAANAFEISIGCIEEALKQFSGEEK